MKPKMLFITPELPYPLQSGGKIKTWNMLRAFAQDWNITLVCPLKEMDADYLEEFRAHAPVDQIHTDVVRIPRSAANLTKSYIKGQPLNLIRTYSSALKAKVARLVRGVDIVIIDHFEVFQFLPSDFHNDLDRPLLVYHAHNAYHQIWQRYAETLSNPLKRRICAVEAKRVLAYEHKVCRAADLVFAAPNDIAVLEREVCSEANFAITLHLGNEVETNLPALNVKSTSNKLCYAGLLSWEPNVQGLLWFLNEVWPILVSVLPGLKFQIAGKNPDPRLVELTASLEGVELVGFVEDLEDLYIGSRICLCPLQFGSGIKVKVAQSLARGIPTVTTSVGAEGLDVVSGKHLMIADTVEDTVSAILRLFRLDGMWTEMSDASRTLMREKYTWDAVFASMKQDIEVMRLAKIEMSESLKKCGVGSVCSAAL